ncbi:MAG: hypothetical protein AAFW84_36145 [Cyanobacteria bacterium J06635_15]
MRVRYLGLSLVSVVAVAGINLPIVQRALADIGPIPQMAQQLPNDPPGDESSSSPSNLPTLVRNSLRSHIAQNTGVPYSSVQVVSATAEIWTDSCLGLGGPAESCLAARYPGWRVELTDGNRTWIYRSDRTGNILRRESPQNEASGLPPETAQRIVDTVANDRGLLPSQVEIIAAESRTWDGCLGIYPEANTICTQIAISGWRVIVATPDQVQVYHTNQDGSNSRLNPLLTQVGDASIAPRFLTGPLPTTYEAPPQSVLTIITSGGIAGRIYKTVLYSDRSIVGFDIIGNQINTPADLGRLSSQDYNTFLRLLETQQLRTFNGLHYPPPEGAADDITVTLISGTNQVIQYSDIAVNQLPSNLQRIHQGWFELIN